MAVLGAWGSSDPQGRVSTAHPSMQTPPSKPQRLVQSLLFSGFTEELPVTNKPFRPLLTPSSSSFGFDINISRIF